ncbi:MAG: anhydro-N-acetylmuramic acid kinase [Chloroflexi bacterium]|nr:anhydro-N-acetylmuramic acid kinase [Chloroflexota bacterium]
MRVIGLMSGTSADGIDAVLAEIEEIDDRLHLRQIAAVTLAWPPEERAEIFRLFAQQIDSRSLCRANFQVGRRFAQATLAVIDAAGLTPADVALIGCHGQTIWHEVVDGQVHSTLQIGDAAVIAEETGLTTVADFRVADVAAGGQGAPLVPIFDWLLMRPSSALGGWRALQNIGGIGNVTFLPPLDPAADSPSPLAFDTGPGNALIDWAAVQMTGGAQTYDQDGRLARQGSPSIELITRWLNHPYFQRKPPKTTGRELFSAALARQWQEEAHSAGLSAVDFIATLTDLTAASIADAYVRFAPAPVAQVVVAGGGARNPVLMKRLVYHLCQRFGWDVPVLSHAELPDAPGDGDSKEALTFALLAWLTIHGRPGNAPACTGASGERLLGKIAPGRNFADVLARLQKAKEHTTETRSARRHAEVFS